MLNVTRAQTLQDLDVLSSSQLDRMPNRWLYTQLDKLGVTHVGGKALADRTQKFVKADLLAAIRYEMKQPREAIDVSATVLAVSQDEAKVLTSEAPHDLTNDGLATEFFGLLKRYTTEQQDPITQQWSDVSPKLWGEAARLGNVLGNLRHASGEAYAPTTKLDVAKNVFKAMDSLIADTCVRWSQHRQDALRENYEQFKSIVWKSLQSLVYVKKQQDKADLDKRKTSVISIDATKMLQSAYAVLSTLDDDTAASQWRLVSVALALATGRRQAELHCTAEFEQRGEYELWFTGQAKTKETGKHKADGYTIPTLIPAHLCVKALEWLKAKGKRVDTPKQVNKLYGRYLSEQCAAWYEVTLGETYQAEKLNAEANDEKNRFIYHGLRQIYALCAIRAYCPSDMQDTYYLATILGHDQDPATNVRYTSDFKLTADSLTHV